MCGSHKWLLQRAVTPPTLGSLGVQIPPHTPDLGEKMTPSDAQDAEKLPTTREEVCGLYCPNAVANAEDFGPDLN